MKTLSQFFKTLVSPFKSTESKLSYKALYSRVERNVILRKYPQLEEINEAYLPIWPGNKKYRNN